MAHRFNEVGRRLMAAVMSHQMGLSLDYTYKHYVPDEIDDSWGNLAECLIKDWAGPQGIAPKDAGPFRVQ